MAVVFVEIDRFRGEGFVITVVILDTGLIYDNLGIFDHEVAYIGFCVQLVRAGNGDVAVDIYPAFQILAIENGQGQEVLIFTAKADNRVFVQGPFCQIGRKGGFAGAGNAKIDVEHVGVLRAEEGAEKYHSVDQGYDENKNHIKKLPFL